MIPQLNYKLDACNDILLSRLCCVEENNHTFNEIETGYEKSSCHLYVDENNALLEEKLE